ncbi:arylamine N-acetyltransferase family protein [Halomicrococcus sp. SG-WS-1]|uniref:arylamine N-acetyltransferase family protein n=1 Tax=Halomicrococcus sp. SG-WS-1 TaxID=3439057 RepID=UPI003F7AA100
MTDDMNHERYLSRIGVEPSRALARDRETLERLQRAHVTAVPFETLSITGDPHGDRGGEGVSLALSDLYEKIVDRERGGFCYELNGLFGWLLDELGFDVDRLSARIASDDGTFGPPADHLVLRVSLDRPYLVDVGLGLPKLRRPVPMDGTTHSDAAGVEWRVVESERPDADHVTRYRRSDADDWQDRYIFRTVPREMHYFEATCEYFQTAPDSAFTGDPVVLVATERGYVKLTPDALTRATEGDERERPVEPSEWYDVLEREFGLRYPSDRPSSS